MHDARRIGFIRAAMLMVHFSIRAPAMAQQDEAALVSKRALELHQASKFSEAMPLAQRALAIPENALGPDHPGARAMAGFGDPVFDAAEEAKALAERRARARVDVARANGGLHGTRIDRAKLPQDQVLYSATDGFIAGDLAGFGEPSLAPSLLKQQTEGLLTASQVAQLKLSADWVVLSACNTVAADKPGAAPLGLARAFFHAGAGALLVSRWSVNSQVPTRLAASTLSIMKTDPKRHRAAASQRVLACVDGKGSALHASGGHFPSLERERLDE
jgi:CHAT domain-containing protein